MRISILATGNELLDGTVTETNSDFIAAEVSSLGYSITRKLCVKDDPEDIIMALRFLALNSDIIVITGGLGPTEDDRTRQCVALFKEKKLHFDREIWKGIEKNFTAARLKISGENRKQAFVIEGSVVIHNRNGTAPGFFIRGEPVIAAFPGVPSELKDMFPFFMGFIRENFEVGVSASIYVNTVGLSESWLDEECRRLLDVPVKIGTIARFGQVTLRFDFTGGITFEKALDKIKNITASSGRLSRRIFSFEQGSTIEKILVEKMTMSGKKVFFAESCTGGLIGKILSDIAGSSAVLQGSIVCYSNEIKSAVLGVSSKTIDSFGAVSYETALEMAEGLQKTGRADYYISVTGIAGPDGGSDEKPVGTVFICFGKENIKNGTSFITYNFRFRGSREMIRMRTAVKVFEMLWLDQNYGAIDEDIGALERRQK